MTSEVTVRKARFKDAESIAAFVNAAQTGNTVQRMEVAERFSQVGFMLAEEQDTIVGLLGWQVENLVIRVTDFLVAPNADRMAVGNALVSAMEEAGLELQAEAALLFLPPNPSPDLIAYWAAFDYEHRGTDDLPRAWREAAAEWNPDQSEVVVKQLRQDLINRPM